MTEREKFRKHVIEIAGNPDFIHHDWFVEHHLLVLERICFELCDIYSEADRDVVQMLVWLHDYGKIINHADEYNETRRSGKAKLREMGFSESYASMLLGYVDIIDSKVGLDSAPIEVKILSSADGAAYLVGPFYFTYWHENPQKSTNKLCEENIRKGLIDWEEKVCFPEIREAFAQRHAYHLERCGQYPDKFL